MTRIIVVGAGIIGVSLAYRLAGAGARVLLIDAARPGAGTSTQSFAWTNANEKTPLAYQQLNLHGMQAHRALLAEFERPDWYHGTGSVEWRSDPAEARELAERVARLQGWGYDAQWIDRHELLEREPAIAPDAVGEAAIARFASEGWVDPARYIAALLHAASASGRLALRRARVTGIEVTGGKATAVTLDDGSAVGADAIVNCTGRWADALDARAALNLPLAPSWGMLGFTPPVAAEVRGIVRSSACFLRPDGAGRLLVHSEPLDGEVGADTPCDPQGGTARALAARGASVLPALAGVSFEAVRIGHRAIPRDGLSAVGPVPGVSGYYVAVTHSGVTLAAHLATLLKAELLDGAPQDELAPFRPARLFD